MNILILGGTTFFGKEIVRQLVTAGHRVGVFTRGNQKPADLPEHLAFQGDRENADDLKRAAESEPWDAVIDNIAYNADHVRTALKIFPTTVHYILCSSISVYRYIPSPRTQPMREAQVLYDYRPEEEDLNDVHWSYARGKLEAEYECVKQRKASWTILRPPVVYGPHDPMEGGFWYLARLLHGGPVMMADGGTQSFRFLSAKDTARAFLGVVENRKKVMRKTYFIAQREIITLKDFIDESSRALGVIPDIMDVPAEILGAMGGPYSTMVNLIPDISAARKDFNLESDPWQDNVRQTALWFRDNWHGDESKILATRDDEIKFAAKWKKLVSGLKTR